MVITSINNIKYDTLRNKARALIVDENNKIILVKMDNTYSLPGGGVEYAEDSKSAILRELNEEIGLTLSDIDYITTIKHFHENYIYQKSSGTGNRINNIDYYYKQINSKELKESQPTLFEYFHKLSAMSVTYDELLDLLNEPKTEYKKFTDEELEAIITYAKDNNII